MRGLSPSRRDALKLLGGALASGVFGASPVDAPGGETDESQAAEMVIDAHIHIVSSRLARATSNGPPFDLLHQPEGAERLAQLIEQELTASCVGYALCMPSIEVSDEDPLGIHPTLAQVRLIHGPKLFPIGVAHPERFDRNHMQRVEDVLKQGQVKALKAYLGYLRYDPSNAGYRPYYRLAAKYGVPVIFHTGDTYARDAKLKHAHPLQIDEIAVDFPDTKFVLAHFGNPWIMDAAQVIYKNKNVWADLSGILIGDADQFTAMREGGVLERTVHRIQEGIEYAEAPDRFLFGSDWPLAPVAEYRDFVRQLFPKEQHAGVFHGNAKLLFGLS